MKIQILLADNCHEFFEVTEQYTVEELQRKIFQNWPANWPTKPEESMIKFIFQGRFLNPIFTLKDQKVMNDSTLHLVLRETLPDQEKPGESKLRRYLKKGDV